MKGLSSVLHEQKNSQLAKLKLQSIFMRFDCFISLMKVLTTLMNIRSKKTENKLDFLYYWIVNFSEQFLRIPSQNLKNWYNHISMF